MAKLRNRLAELMAEYHTRTGQKLTQEIVREKTGVAQSTLSNYINNTVTRYDADTVIRLMHYFKVGPDEFFVVIDNKDEPAGNRVAVANAHG